MVKPAKKSHFKPLPCGIMLVFQDLHICVPNQLTQVCSSSEIDEWMKSRLKLRFNAMSMNDKLFCPAPTVRGYSPKTIESNVQWDSWGSVMTVVSEAYWKTWILAEVRDLCQSSFAVCFGLFNRLYLIWDIFLRCKGYYSPDVSANTTVI